MTARAVVLYARFSPRPNAAECESVEMQLERLRAWCMAHGHAILAEYEDRDRSGARADNRPGLQAAMAHACRERAILAVYSLSRLARNTRDAIDLADRLSRASADLASLRDAVDTSTPTGRFFFTVLAALAQLEREQIAERTADAMQRHQSAGRRMSASPPWGTMIDPENPARLVPCPSEEAITRDILALHAGGMSFRAIARELEARGVPRRGKRGWNHEVVRAIVARFAEKGKR